INQIHRAGGVLSHGLAIVVQHLFGVTVVGGNQAFAAHFQQRVGNAADAFVDALSGFYGGFVHAGVADHVAIGVVAHDQVELAVFNGGDQFVSHFWRAHFRLQIVGGDVGGFHQNAGFARVFFLAATGKEERNVSVFLGFCNAQLG